MFDRRYAALQQRANQRRAIYGSDDSDGGEDEESLRTAPMSREEQEALQQQIRSVTMETIALAHQMRQQLEAFGSAPKQGNPF
eukprot:1029869-Amphidinium_carterae.1